MTTPFPNALPASTSTETDKQRADKLAAAKKRLRTFRAARGSDLEPLATQTNIDNIPVETHARGRSGDKMARRGMRGVTEPSSISPGHSRTASNAGMPVEAATEDVVSAASSRLNTFSFGAKSQATPRRPLLPSLALAALERPRPLSTPILSLDASLLGPSRPPSLLLTVATPSTEEPPLPTTPPRQRKRHSHTRSTSISIPSSRPQSLAAFPISPGLSPGSAVSSPRKLTFGPSGRGAEADKERARASAFASLEGGRAPVRDADMVALPQFEDDEPPLLSFNAPRPFAWTEQAAESPAEEEAVSSWGQETVSLWGQDVPTDVGMPDFALPDFALPATTLPAVLGSVAEEEEEEEETMVMDVKTTPGLKELHLRSSSVTSSATPPRLDQVPASAESVQTPTKGYGTIGRGRPRPLSGIGISSSPLTPRATTPNSTRRRGGSESSISYVRDGSTSSGEGSHDLGRGVVSPTAVLTNATAASGWPIRSSRPCPRPRSLANLAGRGAGRVLGEVDEEAEDGSPLKRTSYATDASYDSGEPEGDVHRQLRDTEMERDTLREDVEGWRHRCKMLEDRLDAEKREAMVLRDRVRKLGDRLSSVSSSLGADDKPSSRSEADAFAKAQGRLLTQMRDQLFGLAAALDAERSAKNDAVAALQEAHLERDAERHVWKQEREAWLALEPDHRLSRVTTASSSFSLGSVSSGYAPPARVVSGGSDYPLDSGEWSKRGLDSLREEEESGNDHRASSASTESSQPVMTPGTDQSASRMKIWGFPRGAVARSPQRKDSIYDSFFTLPSVVEPTDDSTPGVEFPPIPSALLPHQAKPLTPSQAKTFTPSRGASLNLPSSATSALSFFAGYLPSARTPSPETTSRAPRHDSYLSSSFGSQSSIPARSPSRPKRFISASSQPVPHPSPIAQLDFTGGCKHCSHHVFDL